MNPLKSQIVANRERFEKEFVIRHSTANPVVRYTDAIKIKYFLTTSQTSLLQTVIVAVEAYKIKIPIDDEYKTIYAGMYPTRKILKDVIEGHNLGISKVVELLKGGIDN